MPNKPSNSSNDDHLIKSIISNFYQRVLCVHVRSRKWNKNCGLIQLEGTSIRIVFCVWESYFSHCCCCCYCGSCIGSVWCVVLCEMKEGVPWWMLRWPSIPRSSLFTALSAFVFIWCRRRHFISLFFAVFCVPSSSSHFWIRKLATKNSQSLKIALFWHSFDARARIVLCCLLRCVVAIQLISHSCLM